MERLLLRASWRVVATVNVAVADDGAEQLARSAHQLLLLLMLGSHAKATTPSTDDDNNNALAR
jgi:hypothetical protein